MSESTTNPPAGANPAPAEKPLTEQVTERARAERLAREAEQQLPQKPEQKPEAPAQKIEVPPGRKVGKFYLYADTEIPTVGVPRRTPEFDEVLQAMKPAVEVDGVHKGESFVIENKQAASVRTAAKRLGLFTAIRKDGKLPGMSRVWRVSEAPKPRKAKTEAPEGGN